MGTIFGSCYLDSNLIVAKLTGDRPDLIPGIDYILDQYLGMYIYISPMVIGEYFDVATRKKGLSREEATDVLRDFILKYSITITCPKVNLASHFPIAAEGELYADIVLHDSKHGTLQVLSTKGSKKQSVTMKSERPGYSDHNYVSAEITGLLTKFLIEAATGDYGGNSGKLSYQDKLVLHMASQIGPVYFVTDDSDSLLKHFTGLPNDRRCGNIWGMFNLSEFEKKDRAKKETFFGPEYEKYTWWAEKDKGKVNLGLDFLKEHDNG